MFVCNDAKKLMDEYGIRQILIAFADQLVIESVDHPELKPLATTVNRAYIQADQLENSR